MGSYFSQLVHEAILSDGEASLKLHGVKLSKKEASTYAAKLVEQLGSKLHYLSIDRAKLKNLPVEICGGLIVLKHLQLAGNQLTDLPAAFSQLKALTTVILAENELARVPAPLMQCSHLRTLDLSKNGLRAIPDSFGDTLPSLTTLRLQSNRLEDSTTWNGLIKLSKLSTLDLSSNQLKQLPTTVSQLGALRDFKLSNNELSSIDPLVKMPRLRFLELSRLQIDPSAFASPQTSGTGSGASSTASGSSASSSSATSSHAQGGQVLVGSAVRVLSALHRLESLDLSHNKIVNLAPELLTTLSRLVSLKLHNNKILRLPKEVGSVTSLQSLYLQENQLLKIGKFIAQLVNLEILHCEFNNLSRLPQEMKAMSKLHCLMLHHNKFKIIPDPLYDSSFVQHLYTLSLEGNPLTPEILRNIAEKGTREYVLERECKLREEEEAAGKRKKGRPSLARVASQYGSLRGGGTGPSAAAPLPAKRPTLAMGTLGASTGNLPSPAGGGVGGIGPEQRFGSLRRSGFSQRALLPLMLDPNAPGGGGNGSPASSAQSSPASTPHGSASSTNSLQGSSSSLGALPEGASAAPTSASSSAGSGEIPSSTRPATVGSPMALSASTTSVPSPAGSPSSTSAKSRMTRTGSAAQLPTNHKTFTRNKTGSSPVAPSPTAFGPDGPVNQPAFGTMKPKSARERTTSSPPARVSGTTTSLAQIVKHDPTLEVPPYTRFKEAFESLLEQQDLSELRREELRKSSVESKWEMMRIYKGNLVQLLSNNTARIEREKKFEAWQKLDKKVERLASPHYFISSLKGQNISMSDMNTLKTMFESAPLPWIYEFIDVGGISELARFLMHLVNTPAGTTKTPQDIVKESEAISCMSVLASASSSMVLSAPDAVTGVVLCLASDQLATIKPALQLLVLIHTEHSYASKVILQALERCMEILQFPHRFTLLINLLSDLPHLKQDYDVKADTFALITKMCDSLPLIDRYLLRKDLNKVGFEKCLAELNDAPHLPLQQQLEIIDETIFADNEAVKTLAATDYRVLLRIQDEAQETNGGSEGQVDLLTARGPGLQVPNGPIPLPTLAALANAENASAGGSPNSSAPASPAVSAASLANGGNLKVLIGDLGTNAVRWMPTTTVGDVRKKILQKFRIEHPDLYTLFFLATNTAKMEGIWADDLQALVSDFYLKFNGECIASFKMRPLKLNVECSFAKTTVSTELEPTWSVQQSIAHIVTSHGFSLDSDYELSVLLQPDEDEEAQQSNATQPPAITTSVEATPATSDGDAPAASSGEPSAPVASTEADATQAPATTAASEPSLVTEKKSPRASSNLTISIPVPSVTAEKSPNGSTPRSPRFTTPRFEVLAAVETEVTVDTTIQKPLASSVSDSSSETSLKASDSTSSISAPAADDTASDSVSPRASTEIQPASSVPAGSASGTPRTHDVSSTTVSTETTSSIAPISETEDASTPDEKPVEAESAAPLAKVDLPHIPIPSLTQPRKLPETIPLATTPRGRKAVVLADSDTLHELKYTEFTMDDLMNGKVRLQLALKPAKLKIIMGDDGVMMEVDARWTIAELLRHISHKVPEVHDTINDYGIMIEGKQRGAGKRRSVTPNKRSSSRKMEAATLGKAPVVAEWLASNRTLGFYNFEPRKHNLRMALRPRELYVILPNGKEIALSVGFEESVSAVIKTMLGHMESEAGANYSLFSGANVLNRRKSLRDAGVRPGDHLVLRQEVENTQTTATDETDVDIWLEPNTSEFTVYELPNAGNGAAAPTIDPSTLPNNRNSHLITSISFNKIVERLTHPSDLDPDFLEIFLFTYRSFATAEQLLNKLIQRNNVPATKTNAAGEQEAVSERETDLVRVRIYVFLTQWLDRAYQDIDDLLMEKLNIWVENEVQEDRRPLLFSALNKVRTRKAATAEVIPPINIDVPGLGDKVSLLDLDPMEIARQLTFYSWTVFTAIKPMEFFDCAWSKPRLEHLAPNVLEMIARFNYISNWVATELCREPKLRGRRTKFTKLIKVGVLLREMGNFHMLYALITGWNNSAVSRLKWTIEKLPKPTKQSMQELETLMSMEGSFKNYRETLKRSGNTPCIPYIGILLKDLTFIEDGNPNVVNGLINWYKRRLVQSVVGEYLRSALVPSRIAPAIVNGIPINDIIKNLPQLDENGLYEASLKAEPRGAKPEQLQ